MNIENVIKLIDAGYTKDDIQKMLTPAPEPEEKPEPQTDPVMSELKALKDQISKMSITQNAAEIPNEEDKLKAALAKLIGG